MWKKVLPILIAVAWEFIIVILGNWMLNHWSPFIAQSMFAVCTSFLVAVYAWKYREGYRKLLNKPFPQFHINYVPMIGLTVVFVFAISIPIAIGLTNIKSATESIKNTNNSADSLNTSKIPTFIDETKISPSENVTLEVGGFIYEDQWSDFKNGQRVDVLCDQNVFTLYAANGRMYVNTTVYGGPNLKPIQIKGTSFVVLPPLWDQNHDDNSFEVVNENHDPIFQMTYESQFHIVIYGIFPTPKGILWWYYPSGFIINPNQFQVFHLDPIFKYPSSKYLGVRVTDNITGE